MGQEDKRDEQRHERMEMARQRRTGKKKKDEKSSGKLNTVVAIVFCTLQFLASAVFTVAIIELNLLPTNYVMAAVGAIVVFFIISVVLQVFVKIKWLQWSSRILSVLISIVLVVMSFYILKTSSTLSTITSEQTVKLDNMVVAVLADDSAESIVDAADYTFAVQGNEEIAGLDGLDGNVEIVVNEIESELGQELEIIEYASLSEQLVALGNGEVQAIIYNEAYMGIIEDEDSDNALELNVIYQYGIEIVMETKAVESEFVDVGSEAFSVYISGIDVYGAITTNSRSDVNIIATVNPETHQILLVTTPRDSYLEFQGVTGELKDKLTHAGIYGVDVSVATLEQLYDTEIEFYTRVNFTSLVNMVDALGGITVYSEQAFQSSHIDELYVVEGYNDFTGEEALAFSRERYNVDGGDYQRGENQQEVVRAMIEKVTSPSIITGASQLLESVSGNIDTNMSTDQIQTLIKNQIDDGLSWDIIMMSAEGTGGSEMCYSYSGGELFVTYLSDESVAEISEAIQKVLNGEIIE